MVMKSFRSAKKTLLLYLTEFHKNRIYYDNGFDFDYFYALYNGFHSLAPAVGQRSIQLCW